MINTITIKQQQLANTYFKVGSGDEKILVMGSCRVVNYVNYLNEWNEANGNRFTIYSLDPFNLNWNEKDERVDYSEALKNVKDDVRLLDMIRSVDIFIHEYYNNSGVFNCFKKEKNDRNIYAAGMKPKIDICIPNFNDYFILFSDVLAFDVELRKRAIQDFNVLGKLSPQTFNEIAVKGWEAIHKFLDVCLKSDVPEMKEYFVQNFRTQRLWWTYNHTTKNFTLALFKFINDKFLKLDLSKGFNENHEDMFANNYTKLSDYDIQLHSYQWGEDVVSLKEKML